MTNKKIKKENTCDCCGKISADVEYVIDPFQKDVYDIEKYRYLCVECEYQIGQDI